MVQAFIALGTNIEPRYEHIKEALDLLSDATNIEIKNKSSIYETDPVGYLDQADFLNQVIEIETSLASIELLDVCQSIEKELGRQRTIRFGPRTIDLDILIYAEKVIDEERLTVPHPRMHERAFVIVPLAEIAPNLLVPPTQKSVESYKKMLSEADLAEVRMWKGEGEQ